MTAITESNGRATPRAAVVPAALPTRERRPGYIALATALIVGFAALGLYLYQQAGAKTPVVVVTADVPEGHTIQRSDLTTVSVAGGITAIGGGNIETVVGQTARIHLLPNTVLQRSMVTAAAPLAAGQAQVGVAVKSGQIPADGLQPGDTVQVVQVPATGAASTSDRSARVLVDQAIVFSSRDDPSQTGTTLLTLVLPLASSSAVAAASAAGQIALIRIPRA